MPIILAALRTLVIFIIQSGVIVGALQLLEPVIDGAKSAIKKAFNLSDNDSLTYIANFLLDTIEIAGISIATFKSRIPLKIADKLGLTARNFKRGALPAKVSSGTNAPGAQARVAAGATKIPAAADASLIISTLKAGGAGVKSVLGFLERRLNTVFIAIIALSGALDFGNWETGAYSDTMQKLYEKITFGLLKPNEDFRKSKTASDDVFGKVYNTMKISGAIAINDPYKYSSVPFTRDNMLDLIDQLGAKSLLATGSAATKDLIAASLPFIVFDKTKLYANGSTVGTTSASTSSASSSATTTSTLPAVFTGLVSQGTLGDADNFVPRPDDLITDVNDLKTAAANNLAPFLASLPGRVRYEIKVVASYVDKNGFSHRGTTQRIQNGTYANGTPKYKTVTNKFAIANLYILTSKGSRTKIDFIVLGPVDSGVFQPSSDEVATLTSSLESSLTSSYSAASATSSSSKSGKGSSTTDSEPRNTREDGKIEGVLLRKQEDGRNTYPLVYESKGVVYNSEFTGKDIASVLEYLNRGSSYKVVSLAGLAPEEIRAGNYFDPGLPEDEVKAEKEQPASVSSGRVSSTQKETEATETPSESAAPLPRASTLYDYYQARGQSLPSLSERGVLYEKLGLGSASYYTGTAEQNTKLLNALQS